MKIPIGKVRVGANLVNLFQARDVVFDRVDVGRHTERRAVVIYPDGSKIVVQGEDAEKLERLVATAPETTTLRE